jgi:hypothetical protein
MAYTPIGNKQPIKSTYVPIGSKVKKTPTLDSFFPTKRLIASATARMAVPTTQTKTQAAEKVTKDKARGVSISQGQPEEISPIRSLVRAIPGNSRFEKSLERDVLDPIARVGKAVFPSVSDRMRQIVDENPKITNDEIQAELKKRISAEGIALTGKDSVITPDTLVFSPDIVGMIKKVPAKLAERFIGAKTTDKALEIAREVGIKNPSKTILDDIIKINDEASAQRFVDKLKADKVVPTNTLPDLPKLPVKQATPTAPIKSVATKVDDVPTPTVPVRSVVDDDVADPRNFKTADEFVQKNTTGFHATPNKIIGSLRASKEGALGEGVYISRDKESALYASAMEADGNMLDQTAVPVKILDGNLYKTSKDPSEITPEEITKIKKDGFSGIETSGEIVVFDPKNVKTGDELTDIWNQAQQTTPATKPELPALPKLPPQITQRLQTQQADATVNQAVLDRYKNLARRPDVVDTDLVKAAKDTTQKGDTANLFGKLLTPISSRLGRINPKLNTFIRKFEFAVNQNTKKSIDKVRPLMVGSSKMTPADRKLFSLSRLNGDKEVYDALATKYNLTKELKAVEEAYDDIITRGNEVGMDIPRRENYHARVVKNPKAYLNYWRGQEDWGDINRLIEAEAKKKGIKYGDLMKDTEKVVSIINNYIRGYGNKTVLASPSFSKQRTLAVLDEELADFYEDADSALTTYMIRMNDEIEGRRFFGKKADGDAEITDSIGSYVKELVAKGDIKPQQQEEVGDILRARFHRGKMHGALDVYRNAEYISTMGSPISAITQIGDFAWSLYDNGFWNTAKSVVGKKKLTREDLGLDASIMNEFTRDTWSGRAVDRTFKLVGLDKLARLGQETFVNANLAKLQSQARKNDEVLRAQIERVFDADKVEEVLSDLAKGNITDNTKFLAFSRLLDFQPLTKSEMPQTYLEHPNGRMFYMLKSFTLKQYDIYRREGFDLIASGDKTKMKQGVKNLMALSALFMAANATADEIKDLLLDRDTPPSDRVVDNLWRLVGASKYDVYKAREEGIGTTVLRKILFPASIFDRASKDFETIVTDKEYEKGPLAGENYKFESTQTIPVGGKLYYWWFGRGAQKEEYKEDSTATSTGDVPSLPELPELPALPKLPKLPKVPSI